MNTSEVERTKALLKDAIRTFAEPATTYSEAAAGDVVMEAVRLYRRALGAQTSPSDRPRARRERRRARATTRSLSSND